MAAKKCVTSFLDTFLKNKNIDIDSIGNKQKEYLIKTNEAVNNRIGLINAAKQDLDKAAINVLNLAKDINVSRATFYNNKILNSFVEYCIGLLQEPEEKAKLESLKAQNDELSRQIRGLVIRDIKEENLRIENMKLTNEIQNFNTLVQNYQVELEKLNNENLSLKNELAKKKTSKILEFHKKNIKS